MSPTLVALPTPRGDAEPQPAGSPSEPRDRLADAAREASDPLLSCLSLVAARLEQPVHLASLRAGLRTDAQGRIPPEAYPDLARRHGLVAAWSRKALSKLPSYSLPVLLPCQDGRAFVVLGFGIDQQRGQARVLAPDTGPQEQWLALSELDALSTGELLVVKRAAQRADQSLVPLRGAAFGWFWGTLW